jgi:two-component system chemotaxis sensor kinase CheA
MDVSKYKQAYLDEAKELVEQLNNSLLELEKNPDDAAQIDVLFRVAHTLKGMSAAMGYDNLTDFNHKMEDALSIIRAKKYKATAIFTSLMFQCCDVLEALLQDIEEDKESNIDLAPYIKALEQKDIFEEGSATALNETGSAKALIPDTRTLRIKSSHLDHLVDLTGELVIERERLEQQIMQLDKPEVEASFNSLKAVISELQQEIMLSRVVPVRNIFSRFNRLVRDAAGPLGKKINFKTQGEEIEIDKTILDDVAEALVHLLRNAVSHGIEPADEREKAGKPQEGEINLIAAKEKDHILIEVKDDGKGIDAQNIRNKIVEKGFLNEEEASLLTESETFLFLTRPGFSSQEETSDLSGRGVGLDVVKEKIERMGGRLEIRSKKGEGTIFFLRLPLTMAIIQVLLTELNKQIIAIPINNIIEAISLSDCQIKTVQGNEMAIIHDKVLPLLKLRDVFGINNNDFKSLDNSYAVVVESGSHKMGLAVDRLLGRREIVIKPLSEIFKTNKAIGGATVLGDGKVALILDIRSLFEKEEIFKKENPVLSDEKAKGA